MKVSKVFGNTLYCAFFTKRQKEIILLGLLFHTGCKLMLNSVDSCLSLCSQKRSKGGFSSENWWVCSAIMHYTKTDSMPSGFNTELFYSIAGINLHSLLTSLECLLLSHYYKALGIKNTGSYSILMRIVSFYICNWAFTGFIRTLE